jgi:hypothetical protein
VVWYYREMEDRTRRTWLCGLKYLVIEPDQREAWKLFLC